MAPGEITATHIWSGSPLRERARRGTLRRLSLDGGTGPAPAADVKLVRVREPSKAVGVLGRLGGGLEPAGSTARVPASTVDVLLVHCDPDFVSSVTKVLRRHRFSVFSAASAKEAVSTVAQGCTPRLVLLDATHPGLDARRALGSLRSEPACKETRFALLTRATDPDARADLPIDDTLLKPLEVGELLEVLRRQCGPI